MPVQRARAAVGEMREAGRARLHGLAQRRRCGICVAQAHLEAERYGQRNGVDGALALRREREQQRIAACDLAQFADVGGRGIKHQRWIVRAVEAGFLGKERPFDVPTSDGALEFR